MKQFYRFTPHISVGLDTRFKRYVNYFNDEYDFAKVSKQENADIVLKTVDTLKNTTGKKNVIFRSVRFKGLFWFEYAIDFSSSPIVICVKRHWIENVYFKAFGPFIQTNILEPIMYYVALKKGYYFLHASSVEKQGKATCFAGHGGAGKTMTALNKCMKEGYSFMGDDLALINIKSKKLYGFPRPLHLFAYNIFKIPYPTNFWSKLTFWRIFMIIRMKDVIRFFLQMLTKSKLLISTRIDIASLYPELRHTSEATLSKIELIGLSKEGFMKELKEASDLRVDLVSILRDNNVMMSRFEQAEDRAIEKIAVFV